MFWSTLGGRGYWCPLKALKRGKIATNSSKLSLLGGKKVELHFQIGLLPYYLVQLDNITVLQVLFEFGIRGLPAESQEAENLREKTRDKF